MLGIKIHTSRKHIPEDIIEFKKPKYIYIPLICDNDTDITVIPKVGDYVYKGGVVGNNKGITKMFIHSSVSGKVSSIENKLYPNGKEVRCLIIENDFKETVEEMKALNEDITGYDRNEFIEIIKNAGIIEMNGSGLPTYKKFDTDTKIKTLIVNGAEVEPYISSDYALMKSKIKEILEGADAIMEINKIDKCIFCIKKEHKSLSKVIDQYIGTYPKISLRIVPNNYPYGHAKLLISHVSKVKSDDVANLRNIVVCSAGTIYAIYRTLKTGSPTLDRVITVVGDKPVNILVKVGTPIKDILEEFPFKDKFIFITGGPMRGYNLESNDSMITKDLTGILALTPLKREATDCINCGKCNEHCPVNIYPVMIKECIHNVSKLQKLRCEQCIQCGVCSYICPARIDLRNIVGDAKLRVEVTSNEPI